MLLQSEHVLWQLEALFQERQKIWTTTYDIFRQTAVNWNVLVISLSHHVTTTDQHNSMEEIPCHVVGNWICYILLRFQFLTATSMKTAVFYVVALCSLVEVYRHFRGACCLHHHVTHCPDYGGSTNLWNIGKLLPDYTEQPPRRQPSCYISSCLYSWVVTLRCDKLVHSYCRQPGCLHLQGSLHSADKPAHHNTMLSTKNENEICFKPLRKPEDCYTITHSPIFRSVNASYTSTQ
jgi:hypothetical protein